MCQQRKGFSYFIKNCSPYDPVLFSLDKRRKLPHNLRKEWEKRTQMEEKKEQFSPYRILVEGGSGEIIEKKSRFIATTMPVSSEEEAAAFIESMRKKYYDAKHNCPAYIIGRNQELTRCSDDKEPAGTAGRPILEVLLKENLTGAAIVVTRYFGGVLLGTGGLVRAYTEAAKAGLAASKTAWMRYGVMLSIKTNYTDLGRIQFLLAGKGLEAECIYTENVEIQVRVPAEEKDFLLKELTEGTAGRASFQILEEGYYRDFT